MNLERCLQPTSGENETYTNDRKNKISGTI